MTDLRVHVYALDAAAGPDWRGDYPCSTCNLPRRNPVHVLPDTPD